MLVKVIVKDNIIPILHVLEENASLGMDVVFLVTYKSGICNIIDEWIATYRTVFKSLRISHYSTLLRQEPYYEVDTYTMSLVERRDGISTISS